MPDFDAVVESLRAQLDVADRRLAELDRQREDVERQRDRLSTALSVLEEHAGAGGSPAAAFALADSPPLTERVLDAIVAASATNRADLVQLFRPLGVRDNALDSALSRLTKRGLICRRGRQIVPVAPRSSTASLPSPAHLPVSSDGVSSAVDPAPAPVGAALASSPVGTAPLSVSVPPSAPGGELPAASSRRARVLEAVATLFAPTRAALIAHFASEGLAAVSVDSALSGLRQRCLVDKGSDGVYVVRAVSGAASASSAVSPAS